MLTLSLTHEDATTVMTLGGGLVDESLDRLQTLSGDCLPRVRIDFHGIDYINSLGARDWILFILEFTKTHDVTFFRCPPHIFHQIYILPGFLGKGRLESVEVLYTCDTCDTEKLILTDAGTLASYEEPVCPKCQEPYFVDDDELEWLRDQLV